MKIIRESSLHEYAGQFWRRERRKGRGGKNGEAFDALDRGEDPLVWLRRTYDYKLPHSAKQENGDSAQVPIHVALLDRAELGALVIHDSMLDSTWFSERDLIPVPRTTVLSELAIIARRKGYFNQGWRDTQIACWQKWHTSLAGAITEDAMPLVEVNVAGKIEIVDGWGRLLPYEALVQEGLEFYPVPVFIEGELF